MIIPLNQHFSCAPILVTKLEKKYLKFLKKHSAPQKRFFMKLIPILLLI